MSEILRISTTYARIGINTESAKLQIKQPKADIETHQEYPKVSITTDSPRLHIDQTDAYKALGKVPQMEWLNIISNNYLRTGLNAIRKIAEKGEHFQKIHLYKDPIVEHAKHDSVDFSAYDYVGRASCDNVDINVESGNIAMEWSGGKVEAEIHANKPKIDYKRCNVEVYLLQKGKVDITPQKIDIVIY